MKKYVPLCLILLIGCASPNRQDDQIKVFLTEWSKALTAKDASVMRYYDTRFVFPKVVFEAAENLEFNFEIDHAKILSSKDNRDFSATVPFKLTDADGRNAEQGQLILTIVKTENGFLIRDMTQELAVKIKEHSQRLQVSHVRDSDRNMPYDTIFNSARTIASRLRAHYDSVVFFTEVGGQKLFYVINGSWQYPYAYKAQRDEGEYKMGVVTADNQVVVPVAYSKVYNPNGSFKGMIEVENNGLRGLFRDHGEVFLPAQFEGIYPSNIPGVFAQVKKGEKYGWVDHSGKVSFDQASNGTPELFQSPIENNAVLEWEFTYPGDVKVLINPYQDGVEATGIIVYPSYIRDLGITAIANADVMLQTSQYGMGMTDTMIKFEKVESLSEQLFGLISFFMEAGADAREYHSTRNDLLIVDKEMAKISHVEKLTADDFGHGPCGNRDPAYKTLAPGFYESKDVASHYNYYQVATDGKVHQLNTVRQYNFTKFAKIDEGYLESCRYEQLENSGAWEPGKPNLLVINGLSMDELDVMRNEIFAEYGFIFKSAKWKNYFESKPWYKPQYDNVDDFLTEIDKHNIKFIVEYQRAHQGGNVKRDSIEFMWAG